MLLVLMRLHAPRGYRPTLLEVAVPVSFAVVAWLMKGGNFSGALTGGGGLLIISGLAGRRMFVILVGGVCSDTATTNSGRAMKKTGECWTGYWRGGWRGGADSVLV